MFSMATKTLSLQPYNRENIFDTIGAFLSDLRQTCRKQEQGLVSDEFDFRTDRPIRLGVTCLECRRLIPYTYYGKML